MRRTNDLSGSRISSSGGTQLAGNHFDSHGGPINIGGNFDPNAGLHALRSSHPKDERTDILRRKGKLLEGSAQWILSDDAFLNWWDRDGSHLFWIHGDAGKGKTMIMIALSQEIERRVKGSQDVLVYFFCQSAIDRSNSASSVLRGLIYMLACENPQLQRHIERKFQQGGPQSFNATGNLAMYWGLLVEMVCDSSVRRAYFIVDALDECDYGLDELLQYIVGDDQLDGKVKWLLSSRNERAVETLLLENAQLNHMSLEVNAERVSHAVKSFIDLKVIKLSQTMNYSSELRAHVAEYCQEHAEGTFLWVSLVCEQLSKVALGQTRSVLRRLPAGLVELYDRMMNQMRSLDCELLSYIEAMIRSIIIAPRPLRLTEIGLVAGLPSAYCSGENEMEDLVRRSGAFLTIQDEIVHVVHKSARDFLTVGPGSTVFAKGLKHEHGIIAARCLDHVNNLRKNICGFKNPAMLIQSADKAIHEQIEERVPQGARYAATQWFYHLEECDAVVWKDSEVHAASRLRRFLSEAYLPWLECLGLIRQVTIGWQSIAQLGAAIRERLGDVNTRSLLADVEDARQFFKEWRLMIDTAPLQLYSSGLIFSPEYNFVRRTYFSLMSPWIHPQVVHSCPFDQSKHLLQHSYAVEAVACSPDGQHLMSKTSDNRLHLWNATTGVLVRDFDLHTPCDTIKYSPDGRYFAAVWADEVINLYDTSHSYLMKEVRSDPNEVRDLDQPRLNHAWTSFRFLHDGCRFLWSIRYHGIQVWNVETCMLLATLDVQTQGLPKILDISMDDSLVHISSRSRFDTTSISELWLINEELRLHVFPGFGTEDPVASRFSQDASKLSIVSQEGVSIWNVEKGTLSAFVPIEQTFRNCGANWLSSGVISFNSDGEAIYKMDNSQRIVKLELDSGTSQELFEGMTHNRFVHISDQGRFFISQGSILDVERGGVVRFIESTFYFSQFSQLNDSSLVEYASFESNMIKVWDLQTFQPPRASKQLTPSQITFSQDGTEILATVSGSVRLYDVRDVSRWRPIGEESPRFISPDFKLKLVRGKHATQDDPEDCSEEEDHAVMIATVSHGHSVSQLEDLHGMDEVIWSPNSRLLAASASQGVIAIFEALSGKILAQCSQKGRCEDLAFSTNNAALAWTNYSHSPEIWVWHFRIQAQVPVAMEPFSAGPTSKELPRQSPMVSADGEYVATIIDSFKFVAVWATRSGKFLHRLKISSSGTWIAPHLVTFADQGSLLGALVEYDRIITWDASTGTRIAVLDFSDMASSNRLSLLIGSRGLKDFLAMCDRICTDMVTVPPRLTLGLNENGTWLQSHLGRLLWLPDRLKQKRYKIDVQDNVCVFTDREFIILTLDLDNITV